MYIFKNDHSRVLRSWKAGGKNNNVKSRQWLSWEKSLKIHCCPLQILEKLKSLEQSAASHDDNSWFIFTLCLTQSEPAKEAGKGDCSLDQVTPRDVTPVTQQVHSCNLKATEKATRVLISWVLISYLCPNWFLSPMPPRGRALWWVSSACCCGSGNKKSRNANGRAVQAGMSPPKTDGAWLIRSQTFSSPDGSSGAGLCEVIFLRERTAANCARIASKYASQISLQKENKKKLKKKLLSCSNKELPVVVWSPLESLCLYKGHEGGEQVATAGLATSCMWN